MNKKTFIDRFKTASSGRLQRLVIAIIIWLAFGFFNWSALLGYFTTKYPPARSNYGVAFSGIIFGPVGTLPVLVHTNLIEHGFRLK